MWSFLHENKWQKTSIVVMWLETDICNATDLTWFDITYPGLAAVKDKICFHYWHHMATSETEWQRGCIKLLIKMHSVIELWTFLKRGLFYLKNTVFLCICDPYACSVTYPSSAASCGKAQSTWFWVLCTPGKAASVLQLHWWNWECRIVCQEPETKPSLICQVTTRE